MSLISLLTKDVKKVQIGTIVLDASIKEGHEYNAEVTQSPIESGYAITDHVIIKPTKLSIEGIVSATPLSGFGVGVLGSGLGGLFGSGSFSSKVAPLVGAGVGNVLGSVNSFVGGPLGGVTKAAASVGLGSLATLVVGNKSPENAYRDLTFLFENRAPFKVFTRLKFYDNMIITRLDFPKDASTGRSLRFTIELTQLLIITSLDIKVPKSVLQKVVENRGQSLNDLGQAGTKESGPLTSTLFNLAK